MIIGLDADTKIEELIKLIEYLKKYLNYEKVKLLGSYIILGKK